jgi:hypothetical protein
MAKKIVAAICVVSVVASWIILNVNLSGSHNSDVLSTISLINLEALSTENGSCPTCIICKCTQCDDCSSKKKCLVTGSSSNTCATNGGSGNITCQNYNSNCS